MTAEKSDSVVVARGTEKVGSTSASDDLSLQELIETTEGGTPTAYEMEHLRHVAERFPLSCLLVAIVELSERFSYYGLSVPFQNYMQNGPNDVPAGALSLNQLGATALSYFFQFWCYVTPVLGGWLADTYWGKYKTIFISCLVYFVGILILFVTSVPSITSHNVAMGGFIVALVVIGLGTGGVKSNVSPLIADQIPKTRPIIKVLKSGERVVQDPNLTIQNVFMFFYLMINIGSLSVMATTQLEHKKGFWAAYLLPLCFFLIAIITLVLGKNKYVKVPVGDKTINRTFQCAWVGIVNKFNLDAAKPLIHPENQYPWDDLFVEELRRAIYACKVFAFYPIYWVVYGQMTNNFISQAGQMEAHGIPNDFLQAFNSIAIIICIPLCERIIYPFVRRFTPFRAITKIYFGFMFGAAAMVYAAVLQHYIYKAGPCFDAPLNCEGFKNVPNHVNVLIQIPAYVLISLSEILASITGLEYAYTKAPVKMKSFVMSLFLLTNAFGSALGIAVSPTAEDPKLVWTYTGLACACFAAGWIFWFTFKHYNKKEEELNSLEAMHEEKQNAVALAPVVSMQHSVKGLA